MPPTKFPPSGRFGLTTVLTTFGLCVLLITPATADPGANPESATTPQPIPLAFDLERANQLTVKPVGGGELEFTTLGEDPFILLKPFEARAATPAHTVLAWDYFSPNRVDGLSIYYGPPINARKNFAAGSLTRAESWLPFTIDLRDQSGEKWTRRQNLLRIDFGRKPDITFRLRNLRLRVPNAEEQRSRAERETERREKLARERVVNALYSMTFPDRIEAVTVTTREVLIRGRTIGTEGNHLLELAPEISLAERGSIVGGKLRLSPGDGITVRHTLGSAGQFERSVPRMNGGLDRVRSRWAIGHPLDGGGWELRSAWKYATDLTAITPPRPAAIPTGIKGMGGLGRGFPLEELVELGVYNVTMNVTLGSLIDLSPRPGWKPFEFAGRRWFVNTRQMAFYDRTTRFAAEHDIVVSAVLLVNFSDREFGKRLIHPEADRAGHYAMPNFTDSDGVLAFEAALEFLARRYGSGDGPHGQITNWIAHNEVGYGWEWTNMGRQPPMLYMDHYLRSMRLIHNVTRRYDPNSRVFISLTHHWATPSDPDWKSYCNRDLLERLVSSSQVEGDFAWGVAYHPYPQNLRRPDAWNDTRVTDDFDTPLITPKNIAVLDRWMRRSELRDADGRTRGVLLSEQGFNTPDYTPEKQRLQAAGFVYMWRQIRGLKTIEAFHNHRWVDHPREGGLLLGLRTLPEPGQPWGRKKFAWGVYQALDTEAEAEATSFADEIITNTKRRTDRSSSRETSP